MAQQAIINPSGGSVSWSFKVGKLKAAVYRVLLYDASNTVLEKWDDQRTTDEIPDSFTCETECAKLKGATLWWQAIVTDPSGEGGEYTVTLMVEQDGNMLCTDADSGTVPAGNRKFDLVTDQISLV